MKLITRLIPNCRNRNVLSLLPAILVMSAMSLMINSAWMLTMQNSIGDNNELDHSITIKFFPANNTNATTNTTTNTTTTSFMTPTSSISNYNNSSAVGENSSPTDAHMVLIETNSSKVDQTSPQEDNSIKIVAFTDRSYIPIARWWYERMTSLNYTTHTLVLVDKESIDYFSAINEEGKEYFRYDVEIIDKGRRKKNKTRSLWYHRILYCLNNVKAGTSILLTDADNIFSRHVPLSDMYNSEYDAFFAFGGNFPRYLLKKRGFTICGGMMFLKASNATIAVLERLRNNCDSGTERCDDQVEWNKLIHNEINWNKTDSLTKLSKEGTMQYGFNGRSATVIDFKAKIWDVDFAYRGMLFPEVCPSQDLWVAMPYNVPFALTSWYSSDSMSFPQTIREKISRVHLWEAFCGINGINRMVKNGNITERIQMTVDKLTPKKEAS